MKNILLFILISNLVLPVKAQDFFDINTIQTIEIDFDQNNWDDILDTYYASGSEFRLLATVTINGEQFDSVGIRYKGNSSYNTTQNKNPLNIKLDYIKGKQEIDGRNVLKLSNVIRDPSFVREVLSYEIARKYMPASESNYVKVIINGTLLGLYVNDESTNKAFAERHYFKGNDPFFEGDFSPGAAPTGCPGGSPRVFGYLGANQNCYEQYYAIQSSNSNDWNDLINALDTFNNYTNAIENAFYIDRLLWMLALDNVMVNLDSPINPPHNFLLYKDNTDRFNPMLWDLNQSFGSFTGQGSNALNAQQMKELSPWYNATNPNYPIMTIPFASDRYKKMYIAKMKTIFDENFNNNLYSQRITEIQNLISDDVSDDVNKFYSNAEFTQNVNTTVQGIIGIKELMEARKIYLNAQTDFIKIPPNISNISNNPNIVKSNSTVSISAEITNANYVYLGYRFSPKEKFTKILMNASGSTYSASINVAHSDIQYYIWAENIDAGIFSPVRAEYEFHSIGVTGDLVINELQASNENTQFDEAAEYDDWIEIYNNTNENIDLTGYFLSDNKDTLTKWQIPSQNIASDEYIIFWADKDIAQGVNHTNFQLTRNGESLYLVNPNGDIIDQITYPYQERNLSYARYPNGTGPFNIKEPTFKANNGDTITSNINVELQNYFEIYPNPAENFIYLKCKNKKFKKQSKIYLIDNLGRKIKTQSISNSTVEKINISNVKKGIYYIKIENYKIEKIIIL